MSTVRVRRTAAADSEWTGVALEREVVGDKDPEYLARQAHLFERAKDNAREFGEILEEAREATFSGKHGQEFVAVVRRGGRGRVRVAGSLL